MFPRRCPVCHDIVEPPGKLICPACVKKLAYVKEPKCKKCGRPLQNEREEYCRDCKVTEHSFINGASLLIYDQAAQSGILRFKGGRQEYAAFYGREMGRCLGPEMLRWRADALVPIPLHKSRMRERGYNQSALLAREISRKTGIPVEEGLLLRTRKTKSQKSLPRQERQNNLKRAFKISGNDVKLDTVILVDDVYTTGSTIDAAAKALLAGGIARVYFVTLATGTGG